MTDQPDRLSRALDRVCESRAIPGNRVVYLRDGPEAYAAMLDVIDNASRSVNFENYIIRDDSTGKRFAGRLEAAAGRGVDVRVLYDHFGSLGTRRSYWNRLRRAGVTVLGFNRINPLRPLRSVRRNHCKLVAADGLRAVVGGLCIGDEWTGHPDDGIEPWRDTAALIEGAAVPALTASFARRWRLAGGHFPDGSVSTAVEPRGKAVIRPIDGVPGRLHLFQAIQLLAANAAHRLWITDAYLLAPTPLYAGLLAAARDSVDVRLLLPGRTDIPAVQAFARVGYRELLEAGVRIWEWQGRMLHAKTVLSDDVWFKVGSSNLNPSSLLSNYELDVLVEAPEMASAGRQFRLDLRNAVEVVLRARSGPQQLSDRVPKAVVPTEASPPQRGPITRRDVRKRAAMTLAQVAGAARRSIGGAIAFVSVGVGLLLIALPRVMTYMLAALAFWLGAIAIREGLRRRGYRKAP
jgi:cardiolipin synthase